jgi:hypothetical protein
MGYDHLTVIVFEIFEFKPGAMAIQLASAQGQTGNLLYITALRLA